MADSGKRPVATPNPLERRGSSRTSGLSVSPKQSTRSDSDKFRSQSTSGVSTPYLGESNYSEFEWREVQDWGEVKETNIVTKRYDTRSGRKIINRFEIIREIGRGVHGKVKLGRDISNNEHVAIKIVEKTTRRRLGKADSTTQEQKIRKEIAILKKCVHPHVVRLREVMDDPMSKKIYLVLEFMIGGEIIWRTRNNEPCLSVEHTRSSFRDVVLGLEYLHYQGVVHRDIKPANLLWTKNHSVKISDFGVSHLSAESSKPMNDSQVDLELAITAGTPAFFAPELCTTDFKKPLPKVTKAIDIWALGVTLFCLLYGRVPWTGETEFELFQNITDEPLVIPEREGVDHVTLDLLRRLLDKNPETRITLDEVKRHPFVLEGLDEPEVWLERTDPELFGLVEVSAEDVSHAVSIVDKLKQNFKKLGNVFKITSNLSRSNSTNEARSRSTSRVEMGNQARRQGQSMSRQSSIDPPTQGGAVKDGTRSGGSTPNILKRPPLLTLRAPSRPSVNESVAQGTRDFPENPLAVSKSILERRATSEASNIRAVSSESTKTNARDGSNEDPQQHLVRPIQRSRAMSDLDQRVFPEPLKTTSNYHLMTSTDGSTTGDEVFMRPRGRLPYDASTDESDKSSVDLNDEQNDEPDDDDEAGFFIDTGHIRQQSTSGYLRSRD